MPKLKRRIIEDYHERPGSLAIVCGLVLAGFLFLPGGCSTVEGMGKDIQASSRIVREWWNKDKQKEPLFLEASIEEGK